MDVRWTAALALALAAGAGGTARAETFRCPLADRVAAYQQTPCAVPELPDRRARSGGEPEPRARDGREPERPKALPIAAPAGDDAPFSALTPGKREVLDLSARFERCRADEPVFADRTADLYRAWRRRHADTLSEYSRLLATKVRIAPRGSPASCNEDWIHELEPLTRAPDPRFSSVEKTWQVFVAALLAADRSAVMASVSGPVARTMGERLGKLADADLRRMAANIRELKLLWGDDYDREALVVHGDRVDGVVFRKNVNEEWKLREMKPAALRPAATARRSSPDS